MQSIQWSPVLFSHYEEIIRLWEPLTTRVRQASFGEATGPCMEFGLACSPMLGTRRTKLQLRQLKQNQVHEELSKDDKPASRSSIQHMGKLTEIWAFSAKRDRHLSDGSQRVPPNGFLKRRTLCALILNLDAAQFNGTSSLTSQ